LTALERDPTPPKARALSLPLVGKKEQSPLLHFPGLMLVGCKAGPQQCAFSHALFLSHGD